MTDFGHLDIIINIIVIVAVVVIMIMIMIIIFYNQEVSRPLSETASLLLLSGESN